MARHDSVAVPSSKIKLSIARILKEEGFIDDYEVVKSAPVQAIKIHLKYYENNEPAVSGLERLSKPGLRVYVGRKEIPRVHGGLGITILSTPKGVKTGQQAWHAEAGGELLCQIW